MNAVLRRYRSWLLPALQAVRRHPDITLAAGMLGMLFVILVPLPPGLVDSLLILNVTVSVVVLLTAACVTRPVEFSVFPSLLLVTTLFRLALNIATTRLVLGNAADGARAAGRVVETFAGFVAGDNPVIGLIVFAVLVVVQFVVITKGATRVSEVAARFQLDSLPGKQMSIDGDLASGFIDQDTARRRREEVGQEADFYGAMDGASKFVRGDAVAGLFIVLINITGGVAVGFLYHDMQLGEALNVFSRLTIGDGLVSQVPALMLSMASALLVTRSGKSRHLGRDLGRQILSNDHVLFVASGFLLCLLPSGLPPLALLVAAGACALSGWLLRRERSANDALDRLVSEEQEDDFVGPTPEDSSTGDAELVRALLQVEPLTLEIGYRLLPLFDESRGGGILPRLSRIRESLAISLGVVVPPIAVRDSRSLGADEYRLLLRGGDLGRHRAITGGVLAVAKTSNASIRHREPTPQAFSSEPIAGPEIGGMRSYWFADIDSLPLDIDDDFEVYRSAEAIALHVEQMIRANAASVLTREEVSRRLEDLSEHAPNLVADLVPGVIRTSELHRVLQELVREGVSIRDLETILETLARIPPGDGWIHTAVATVRRALARSVCASCVGRDGRLHAVVLDAALEEFLVQSLEGTNGDAELNVDPQTTETIVRRTADVLALASRRATHPAVLCPGVLRPHVWRMIGQRVPKVAVLSYDEIFDESAVEVHGSVALEPPGSAPGAKDLEVNGAR